MADNAAIIRFFGDKKVTKQQKICLTPLADKAAENLSVSFEFFPPKTDKMAETLWACVERLAPLSPDFVSVTYGAGGSTRERTHDTVTRIARETKIPAAAHLTCEGATRDELDEIARRYWEAGIRHIVALRGDPPNRETAYAPHPGGYGYAYDLVAGLKRVADFEISVAAYPELHPQSPNMATEIDNLKRKVDAGATRAITQFFFDNTPFFRLRDEAAAAGITIPIIPGIMPILSFAQASSFAKSCNILIPDSLAGLFDGIDEDERVRPLVSAMFTAEQCRSLVAEGVDDLHFFTLNRADLTYAICHILGIRPQKDA